MTQSFFATALSTCFPRYTSFLSTRTHFYNSLSYLHSSYAPLPIYLTVYFFSHSLLFGLSMFLSLSSFIPLSASLLFLCLQPSLTVSLLFLCLQPSLTVSLLFLCLQPSLTVSLSPLSLSSAITHYLSLSCAFSLSCSLFLL